MGELATTQGDAQKCDEYSDPPHILLFPDLAPSVSFPLGPNELETLVVIGGQMCGCSCLCDSLVMQIDTSLLAWLLPHQNSPKSRSATTPVFSVSCAASEL